MFLVRLAMNRSAIIGCRGSLHTSSATSSQKRRTWISYSMLVFPATAFALGFWQIRRRKWKIELIDALNARIPAKPIHLTDEITSSLQLPEFTHISVEGHFDHSREVIIGPRSFIEDMIPSNGYGAEWLSRRKNNSMQSYTSIPSASGYFVVTPFFLENRPGTAILVNRGWVPYGARDPIIRPNGQVEGTVKLSGYVRYPEKPPLRIFGADTSYLMCLDQKNQNPHIRYPCRYIEKMCEDLKTLPIFIDADYESTFVGGPVGGQTRVTLRNEHASYIFTWFSLGTIGLGMWIYFFLM